ncbi:hypothetical protein T03_14981 [Trichinella britovi]|uniref:Uncharacterized protein n=1 Tax=Trichinella britovi TaxID=45882 RepID=A0A0V1CUC8_TRIBR|nr:hypothetical protein T03_14981 [Trichinella britovi]
MRPYAIIIQWESDFLTTNWKAQAKIPPVWTIFPTSLYVYGMTSRVTGCLRGVAIGFFVSSRRNSALVRLFAIQRIPESTGTIKRNKPELPQDLLALGLRTVHSSKFVFAEPCTAVSYIPEKHRIVPVLSTVHKDASLSTSRGS